MRTRVVLCLLSSCIFCGASFAQASSPECSASAQATAPEASPADAAEFERLVGIAKNLPARTLERRLPRVAFGDWLEEEAGPDTPVTWAVLADLDAPSPRDHVEVGVHAKDGRNLIINVAVGPAVRRPHVLSVFVRWACGYQQTDMRMREVPSMLREIRQLSDGPQ